MADRRVISWFSCGAASAVATKLTLFEHGHDLVTPAYCQTGAEHEDNKRFMTDCEKWFGKPVERLQSDEYLDTWDVWQKRRYIAGINGAPCTVELKVGPRLLFQRPSDIHVFGYTADGPDIARAERLRENYPELTIETPLIERGLTKNACLSMIESAGISIPVMYRLGFQNNNCIPCGKATSPNYWSAMRKNFPVEFQRMAVLARELGARLCRLEGERIFIDEVPTGHPTIDPIAPACDFLCHIAEQDIAAPAPAQKAE
jgi:hypothetical protein